MNASIRLNRIRISMAILAVATVLLGSLNHFIYEWSGENVVAGLLFATNESVWEHIKLALLPMLLFGTTLKKVLSTPRFANASAIFASLPP